MATFGDVLTSPAQADAIDLHPSWAASANLFLSCATQWRRSGLDGDRTGLDYAALAVVARARGIRLSAAIMDDLQAMEAEALIAWSETPRQSVLATIIGARR